RYQYWAAGYLQRAVQAFAFLRRSRCLDGSKFLLRPALEMAFKLEASRLDPEMFYRIALEEYRQDNSLAQGQPQLLPEIATKSENFKKQFAKEFPNIPMPILCAKCDKLTIEKIAVKAEMAFYYKIYRIYCRFTHGAMQAATGMFDQPID